MTDAKHRYETNKKIDASKVTKLNVQAHTQQSVGDDELSINGTLAPYDVTCSTWDLAFRGQVQRLMRTIGRPAMLLPESDRGGGQHHAASDSASKHVP